VKLLLTGAGGFIGSRLLRLALDRGHQVAALDFPGTPVPPAAAGHKAMSWLEGTLSEAPWKSIEAFQPEQCIHCAWTTAPKFAYDSPEHFRCLQDSKLFLARALDAGVKHILGVGTCIEYRIDRAPLVEDKTPLEPVGAYAESKNGMRAWLQEQAPQRGFQFGWGRIFYVYGVGEHPTRLCSAIIQKVRRKESIVLKTPQSTKDYIYIDDVIAALMLMAERKVPGAVNIGTGLGITIFDLAQTVEKLLGKSGLVQKADPPVPDPLDYVVADSTRLRMLGWQPQHDLERGLRKLIEAVP